MKRDLVERKRAMSAQDQGRSQIIGSRFKIADLDRDLIGRGGMGDVYQGTDLQTGQTVAIKALRPEVVFSDPNALARFRREGEALRQLNHPNIVQIVDALEAYGATFGEAVHYLVMEYVPGGSLRDLLEREGRLSIARTAEIALDVADALTHAHRVRPSPSRDDHKESAIGSIGGILHRDLKPSNVLLAEDGTPRLSDFGIAHVAGARPLTQTGGVVGTVDYLSPEACNLETLDARADIWAFGVMLYEMLAGERPFTGDSPMATLMAILRQPVPDLAQVRPDVPESLADLVYRMLEKDRAARIPSVRLVGAELEAISQGFRADANRGRFPSAKVEGWELGRPKQPQITESRFAAPTPTIEAPEQLRVAHNLPVQPTPFVGREAELVELDRLLSDPDVRLVTILGVGGMGKTRLALEAAARQLDRYTHGVYWVSLAPLSSVEAIVPTVASALGFTFYGAASSGTAAVTPRRQLLDYLSQKRILLLFDNFEHLLEGVNLVGDILQVAPAVRILATSRASLNIQEEHLYHIGGMEFSGPMTETSASTTQAPDKTVEDAVDLESRAGYSAVKLFVQGARRVRPDYMLQADDLQYVSRICRLVQGMPLGILLAAAWMEMLSPKEIARELASDAGQSLDFLATELRNVPERQRSMRAVFDHSWSLLTVRERGVMEALSVFRGGFTRKAAQEVTEASLRELMALVSKSLLHRAPTGRYEVHELLRQYAERQLDIDEKAAAARDAHSAHYAMALEQWAVALKGPRQQAALAEIEDDAQNTRAAWEWAVERGQVEWLNQALEGLGMFHKLRMRYEEGEAAFRAAASRLGAMKQGTARRVCVAALTWQALFNRQLGRAEVARQLLQRSLSVLAGPELAGLDVCVENANVLLEMGWIEYWSGNREQAKQLAMQSLSLCRTLDDRRATGNALSILGNVLQMMGEYEMARQSHQEALDIRRTLGDQRGIIESLAELGMAFANQGQFHEAERSARESVAIGRQLGDRICCIAGLFRLANVLNSKGEFTEGVSLSEENLAVLTDLGTSVPLAWARNQVGFGKAHLGQYNQARVYLQQGLALARQVDFRWGLGSALLGLGYVALAEEQYADARQRLQESIAVLRETQARSDVGRPLALLAGTARGLGRFSEAREYLCEALQIAAEIRDLPTAMHALPVAALLVASQDPADLERQAERAVEIYALASRYGHVAHSRLWEDITGRHITALVAELPPDVVTTAQARGQARDLWTTVAELLAELEG
jgi:serine/threonine protein kinase/predicted ATPase